MFVGQIKNLFIHLDRRLLSWAAVLCILVIIYGYVYDFCCKQGSNPMTSYMLLRECPVTREQTLKPRSYGLGTTALRAKTGAGNQECREVIREKSGTGGGEQKENTAKTQTMQCV